MLEAEIFWGKVIPNLNQGLLMSVALIIPSSVLGFLVGVAVGAVRVFAPAPCRKAADAYVAVFRGVPLLLQLYFLYYCLPRWGIVLGAYEASVLGFVLCSAAYQSEYIRGALLSIRQGQINAARALGFSTTQMVICVIVPQALRRALPGCGNEIIYLIKYSSLAHLLTIMELTGGAKELTSRYLAYTDIYLAAGIYYLALTTLATWILRRMEKRTAIPGFTTQH